VDHNCSDIAADGSSDCELVGASSFPRHWIYDDDGRLAAKSGLIDYDHWYYGAFGEHSPWGHEDSSVVVSAVESALERELSRMIIGSNPQFRRLKQGESLVEQGDPGGELFLLFDGVLRVEQDGEPITEVGPGALLGEMALLEGGVRVATLRAVTACRVAVVPGDRIDRSLLSEVEQIRRRPRSDRRIRNTTARSCLVVPDG
jgi:CRP-like cAMP-binding protein